MEAPIIYMTPDAIVIFSAGIMPLPGGGWRTTTYDDRDAFGTLGGRDRVEAAAVLAKKNPEAHLIATSHTLGRTHPTLAGVYADELRALGVPAERIVKEEQSTTSATAVTEVLRLAEKKGWKRVVFLSSGFHLPRIAAFYKREKSAVTVEFVSSESVLLAADPAFAARFAAVQKTPAYLLRLGSERRGLAALKKGTYRSAPARDKRER